MTAFVQALNAYHNGDLAACYRVLRDDGYTQTVPAAVHNDPVHRAYREANLQAGRYPGQQHLQLEFPGQRGPVFPWLHLAADQLKQHCDRAGLHCEVLLQEDSGH